MKIKIPENLEFSMLHLVRDVSPGGNIQFSRRAIEHICEANALDMGVFSGDEDNLSWLLMGWYAKHRELRGAPDPVMEDLIAEVRIEDRIRSHEINGLSSIVGGYPTSSEVST